MSVYLACLAIFVKRSVHLIVFYETDYLRVLFSYYGHYGMIFKNIV